MASIAAFGSRALSWIGTILFGGGEDQRADHRTPYAPDEVEDLATTWARASARASKPPVPPALNTRMPDLAPPLPPPLVEDY